VNAVPDAASIPACARAGARADDSHAGELRAGALQALALAQPADKCAAVAALRATPPRVDAAAPLWAAAGIPGRPARPLLVLPSQVPQRPVGTPEGRAALVHALAHIEFNAINLALDAIWRFAGMPEEYYHDWLQVAAEEAQHFSLLRAHLATLGHAYGDFAGHDGLWQMAERTQADVLARMALVPRTLEARGLDASPAVRNKLASVGDHAAAAIVDVILRDEIGHVAIGNRWYRWCCGQRGLDPLAAWPQLVAQYGAPALRGPFNLAARRAAGFSPEELSLLQAGDGRAQQAPYPSDAV
jgi:uncharacterized ferritin-like protein (DUF455 family)